MSYHYNKSQYTRQEDAIKCINTKHSEGNRVNANNKIMHPLNTVMSLWSVTYETFLDTHVGIKENTVHVVAQWLLLLCLPSQSFSHIIVHVHLQLQRVV